MNWPLIKGIILLATGLFSFAMVFIFGWDILREITMLQIEFLKEHYVFMLYSFIGMLGGILLIGSSD